MKKIIIEKTGLECLRCGHIWIPRREMERLKCCPKCHSPYWDRERERTRVKRHSSNG